MAEPPDISAALNGLLALKKEFAEVGRPGSPEWLQVVGNIDFGQSVSALASLSSELGRTPSYLQAFAAVQTAGSHGISKMGSEIAAAQEAYSRLFRSLPSGVLQTDVYFPSLSSQLLRSVDFASQLVMLRDSAVYSQAEQAASLASAIALPSALEPFRLAAATMTDRLAIGTITHGLDVEKWSEPAYLAHFSAAAATAKATAGLGAFNTTILDSMRGLQLLGVPESLTIGGYRSLLDTAGLTLARWPQLWSPKFRPATEKERAARQKARLSLLRQPPHIGKAKSLVHQYECYLRHVIDETMAAEYGENWPDERLPLCGPKGRELLGRWKDRGGHPLQHADYPHYTTIMVQPEHHEAIFCLCFADPSHIDELIAQARKLRAASHHPGHTFTPQDLRDLRTTWRSLTKGLSNIDGVATVAADF